MASISHQARLLGVARQTMYYHLRRPDQDRALRDKILFALDGNPAYGHRRLATHLKTNKKAILRVMRKYGIRPKVERRRFRYEKADGYAMERIPNRMEKLTQIKPDTVWAGDFTKVVCFV